MGEQPDAQFDLIEYMGGEARPKKSHIWKVAADEHYVEEQWVNDRLFAEEKFVGNVIDPCCGFGRVVDAAERAGLEAHGFDIVNRGVGREYPTQDFLTSTFDQSGLSCIDNIVMNPPFKQGRVFVEHALTLAEHKVAAIVTTRRLNAMGKLLEKLPLRRIWFLTPRPSMPPGEYILSGKKPGGGSIDFCWIVMEQGFEGVPEVRWLHRDGKKT